MSRVREHQKGDSLRSRRPQIRQQRILDTAAPRAESFADAVHEHFVSAADDGRDVLTGVEQHDLERPRRRRLQRARER
ncbi:MAG: hypothetical protein ACREKH_15465, partial [Candidatus Rokuibacteriota bacterium]